MAQERNANAWETQYRPARLAGQIVADAASDAISRLVGVYIIDDRKPPKDADPDRELRLANAVKITEAHCDRCGADLLGGVLPFVAAGTTASCPMCGRSKYFPTPDEVAPEHERHKGVLGKFRNPESETARSQRLAREQRGASS